MERGRGRAEQFYTALAGAGRPLVGRLGRAVLGRSPAGYTGRLSGLVGLAVSGRAVPGPAGLG
jgi:hypothetical protein